MFIVHFTQSIFIVTTKISAQRRGKKEKILKHRLFNLQFFLLRQAFPQRLHLAHIQLSIQQLHHFCHLSRSVNNQLHQAIVLLQNSTQVSKRLFQCWILLVTQEIIKSTEVYLIPHPTQDTCRNRMQRELRKLRRGKKKKKNFSLLPFSKSKSKL